MNEAPKPPPSRPRPQKDEAARRRQPMSKESRFTGYLVLGFGVLAIVTVLLLAFSGGGRNGDQASSGQDDVPTTLTPASAYDLMSELQAPPRRQAVVEDSDLFFKRTPDFNAKAMEGDWQAAIGRYTAVLQIRGDVYQIIMASDDPAMARYFSSGTYRVIEDIILLTPRGDWPPPTAASGSSIRYTRLTSAPFPVIARFDGGQMLWQNKPQSERRVVGPYNSPLFLSENVKLASWKKLK